MLAKSSSYFARRHGVQLQQCLSAVSSNALSSSTDAPSCLWLRNRLRRQREDYSGFGSSEKFTSLCEARPRSAALQTASNVGRNRCSAQCLSIGCLSQNLRSNQVHRYRVHRLSPGAGCHGRGAPRGRVGPRRLSSLHVPSETGVCRGQSKKSSRFGGSLIVQAGCFFVLRRRPGQFGGYLSSKKSGTLSNRSVRYCFVHLAENAALSPLERGN